MEATKLLQMHFKTNLRIIEPQLDNRNPFGILKVLLHKVTGTVTVTMVVTMNPWTLHRKLVLEVAVGNKAVASSSIKAHRNIKVKVADKNNNMPRLSISNQHSILEMTIINRMLATLPTEKYSSLPIKIGRIDSRMNLTTVAVEVDKVAEIGKKTTKAVVMVVMVVVGAEVAVVEKAISIIMIGNSRPTRKTTRRTKNKRLKSLLRRRLAWKHQMSMRPSRS